MHDLIIFLFQNQNMKNEEFLYCADVEQTALKDFTNPNRYNFQCDTTGDVIYYESSERCHRLFVST